MAFCAESLAALFSRLHFHRRHSDHFGLVGGTWVAKIIPSASHTKSSKIPGLFRIGGFDIEDGIAPSVLLVADWERLPGDSNSKLG